MRLNYTERMLQQGKRWAGAEREITRGQARSDLASLLQIAVKPQNDNAAQLRRLLGLQVKGMAI